MNLITNFAKERNNGNNGNGKNAQKIMKNALDFSPKQTEWVVEISRFFFFKKRLTINAEHATILPNGALSIEIESHKGHSMVLAPGSWKRFYSADA